MTARLVGDDLHGAGVGGVIVVVLDLGGDVGTVAVDIGVVVLVDCGTGVVAVAVTVLLLLSVVTGVLDIFLEND